MSNSLSQRVCAAIRRSDRKTSQLLGVTLRSSFSFRFHLGKKHTPSARQLSPRDDPATDVHDIEYIDDDNYTSLASSESDDYNSEPEGESDLVVWDVPNPFAPPDPSQAHIQALIRAEIARMRRYEMIGPFQSLLDEDQPLRDEFESEFGSDDHENGDDEYSDGYEDDVEDGDDYEDSDDYGDGDDEDDAVKDSDGCEDADDEDSDADNDNDNADRPNVIALPRLLHSHPLCFIPSSQPPSPPPSSPFSDTASTSASASPSDEDPSVLWHDLARVYNDDAEAEERVARKAKRDAHRSRLKALAILGPEAASAI